MDVNAVFGLGVSAGAEPGLQESLSPLTCVSCTQRPSLPCCGHPAVPVTPVTAVGYRSAGVSQYKTVVLRSWLPAYGLKSSERDRTAPFA